MANPKPVTEVRIGRVKATVWKNGTEDQPRYNVTFSRLYKDGDQWKSTQSFGRNDLLVLAESGRSSPHAHLPASGRSRTPGGSSRRVLAGNRARARRSRSLRRACFFLPASIECLLVVPFRSQRPAVGGVPGQLSRQNASLAFSVCHSRCLIWSLPVAPRSL